MKVGIFSIYDSKAEAYLAPFTMMTVSMAIRAFEESINTETHTFSRSPSDYTLIELGTFDDHTAKIDILLAPNSHGTGLQYMRSQPTQINPKQIDIEDLNP
ncbi:MAG: nonstructural protein [Microviridae sp.]|nr:MAG: nonstructural protein [Microviridae sp.]